MRLLAYQVHLLLVNAVAGMIAVSSGWHAYQLTNDPMTIGVIGLLFFVTAFLMFLPSGMASDRFNKRSVIIISQIATITACILLARWQMQSERTVDALYFAVFFAAMGRSFESPASAAILPELVNQSHFPRMVAISTSTKQIAKVGGPLLAGSLLTQEASGFVVYFVTSFLSLASILVMFFFLRGHVSSDASDTRAESRWQDLLRGVRYIATNKLLLGAILLDLLAGLFGNLTALLPIFVRDILGQQGDTLGLLRSSIAMGTFAASIVLGLKSLPDHIGKFMVASVFLLGAVNASLAWASSVWVSWVILFGFGAIDSVSVYIRQTLIQLATPKGLRGRVTAANQLSIVISNQLGEFRSGSMAAILGLKSTIMIGGAMTVVFAIVWPKIFPAVWSLGRFSDADPARSNIR